MENGRFDPRYRAAIGAGFELARQQHRSPGPVHFLVGIAQGDGPAAAALGGAVAGTWLRAALSSPVPAVGPMTLHMQAQEAAGAWADARGEPVNPEHLLLALLDQGSPDVLSAIDAVGVDAGVVRRTLLRTLGPVESLPPIPLPAPSPAGTLDHPALPLASLPGDLWTQLRWRQEHLPLDRLRRPRDLRDLYHLERRAAGRLAARAHVNDDISYSLLHHHIEEVERRAAPAGLVATPVERPHGRPRPRIPNVFVGWGTWFGNRAVNLNAARFKWTTRRYYRRSPAR